MGKFKYLLLLLFIPVSVYASCDSSTLSRYKGFASNINNYYEYVDGNFNVVFYNVSDGLRIINKSDNHEYSPDSNLGNVVVNGLAPGSVVNFVVYPVSGECREHRVFSFYINLPYFNKYYTDPICSNYNNVLCSKWANTSMYSYEQFINAVKNSEEKIVDQEPEQEVRKYGFFDFLGDYYIFILLFIIAGGIVGIYFLDKKSKFDFKVS